MDRAKSCKAIKQDHGSPAIGKRTITAAVLRNYVVAPKGLIDIDTISGINQLQNGLLFDLVNGGNRREILDLHRMCASKLRIFNLALRLGISVAQPDPKALEGTAAVQ